MAKAGVENYVGHTVAFYIPWFVAYMKMDLWHDNLTYFTFADVDFT